MDMSQNTATVDGGKKIIILCEKVSRDDIKVRFYDPHSQWEGWGDFKDSDVHKQYAITLKTPRYENQIIIEKRKILLQLVKPSDGTRSDPKEFYLLPLGMERKGIILV